nr:hypothetical protein [Sphingomonas bacterium]
MVVPILLAGCVPRPEPPRFRPELVLDIADPIVEARIGGIALRLRVDLDRRNSLELNPAAAARLPLAFEEGMGLLVGRIELTERNAAAPVTFDGVTVPLTLSTYDRDCCTGSDGAIGPDLLPYERVRFVRSGALGGGAELRLPLVRRAETGLSAVTQTQAGALFVGFSLSQASTLATAAAGAILAKANGGRFVGNGFDVAPAFGVMRPARTIAFDRPPLIAGFRIAEVPVRIGDFRGEHELPREAARRGDIVVQRHRRAQVGWPAIMIGRDRLDRCSEILFRREPTELTLRCAFDAVAP